MPVDKELIKLMTKEQKSVRVIEVRTKISELREELTLLEARDEEILMCATCGKDIIAYGERGESFVTTVKDGIEKHYHNKKICAP